MTAFPTANGHKPPEYRHLDDPRRIPHGADRRVRVVLQEPRPAPPRAKAPLPDPSDWTFELI
jgi:stage V sporulation protein R